MRPGRLFRIILAVTACGALAACAHTTNEPLWTNAALCSSGSSGSSTDICRYDPNFGYRFEPEKNQDRDTLVVLTFSGGGIRASALAYGTLKALQELPGLSGQGHLLDEVDIISSVSGGSVTAGWYALKGQDGLASDEGANALLKFLHAGGMGSLVWRALNPAALTGYAVTPYQRSDVLAGFFSDRLFHDKERGDATYADVQRKYREKNQPFVILNATDLGHETRFPFTQNRFDLICSDLSQYKLAYAVAASADFPVVFSPIGIRNYSRDCTQVRQADAWTRNGPPRWIERYIPTCGAATADRSGADVKPPRVDGLLQLRAARQADDYVNPGPDDTVLHLLDGGLVDNLGIYSTLEIEDDASRAPGLFQRLRLRDFPSRRYRNIQRVLYVVVNARSRSPTGIDNSVYPPDALSSMLRVIDTSVDSTVLSNQNYLTAELEAIIAPPAKDERIASCSGPSIPPERQRSIAIERVVAVDFELIPNQACRDKFWEIGTTWTLDRDTIDQLIALPKLLLRRSLELTEFYTRSGQPAPAFDGFPKDFTELCADRSNP